MTIRRAFVRVGGRDVHYRTAGVGPTLVLLHDSPRSSRLHEPLLEALSDRYEVIALDTPGYGDSDALPGSPDIPNFSAALAATLEALGIGRAAFYGFHTSSKILLDFAARHPERVSLAVLDGLSIPLESPDETFIVPYMRPFEIDEHGAWLSREWTRVLDTWRWFPWFRPEAATRMPIAQPSIEQIQAYALDYVLAGPNYASAYAAAMRHDPRDNLHAVSAPIVVLAREDDVLHSHLERVPVTRPLNVEVWSVAADPAAWLEVLRELFAESAREMRLSPEVRGLAAEARTYVSVEGRQVLVRRLGPDDARPLLYLHDVPGGAGGEGDWLKGLAARRAVYAVDLPGCGGSDPLPDGDADAYADWLAGAIKALGLERPDIVAEGFSAIFALWLAVRDPRQVGALVLDGAPLLDDQARGGWREAAAISLKPERSGAHWSRTWHLLRDREAQYPWWDGAASAIRHREPDISAERLRQHTLDVLKQPQAWSAALRAALEADATKLASMLSARVLFPRDAGDPRQAGAEALAALAPRASVVDRAATLEDRAAQYLDFLDAEDV